MHEVKRHLTAVSVIVDVVVFAVDVIQHHSWHTGTLLLTYRYTLIVIQVHSYCLTSLFPWSPQVRPRRPQVFL